MQLITKSPNTHKLFLSQPLSIKALLPKPIFISVTNKPYIENINSNINNKAPVTKFILIAHEAANSHYQIIYFSAEKEEPKHELTIHSPFSCICMASSESSLFTNGVLILQ